eukprot:gene18884-24676_t
MVVRMIIGLCQSVVTPYSSGIINELFSSESKGIAFGVYNIGVYLAFSLSLSLGTYIYDTMGWKAGYIIFGLVVATTAPNNNSTNQPIYLSIYQSMKKVINHWNSYPVIYLICLSTGIRLGGGYIWSAYTSIFFSELFNQQPEENSFSIQKSCLYSYSNVNELDVCPIDYPFCRSGYCYTLNQNPWHNKGLWHIYLEEYMSWVPICGSALGRLMIAGIGTLIAAPLVSISFYLPFPSCFLILVASGLVGEVYLSQTLAILSDLSPADSIVTSIALFMFFITLIGGNTPVLVPLVHNSIQSSIADVNITFTASSIYTTNSTTSINEFIVSNPNALGLQITLAGLLGLVYVVSALLFLLSM